MIVSEYEREFVRLSKYARDCILTEVAMCKQFKEGLNEDIKLLVRILELKEFVVLADRAHKAEELNKEKRQAEMEARTSNRGSQCSNPRSLAPSVANAVSVRNSKPKCNH
ncbi:Gag-Pol polyprotein [Gossypium australe]|uniref:Gag-Pol polyprotein n=1 Tax=Gossypium australe TaxID=47621 RepID=A0A5B6VX64_9ROSI|nr:Gag-Pol polyprotein [Gossypium australe]